MSATSRSSALGSGQLEASKGGRKVGRIKGPLYKDAYLGITPPTFILPFEAPEPDGICFLVSRIDPGPAR